MHDLLVILFYVAFFSVIGLVYIVPTIVAFRRGIRDRWAVLVVNLTLGSTGVFWVGSLVYAWRVDRDGSLFS